MTQSELTPEQERNFNLIELRIVNQRYVEILDDLLTYNLPTNNKKLKSQLKGTYEMLKKETKKYDELFDATSEGTTAFYNICCDSAQIVMSNNIIDKNLINKCLTANKLNPKALEGILDKILKEKQ